LPHRWRAETKIACRTGRHCVALTSIARDELYKLGECFIAGRHLQLIQQCEKFITHGERETHIPAAEVLIDIFKVATQNTGEHYRGKVRCFWSSTLMRLVVFGELRMPVDPPDRTLTLNECFFNITREAVRNCEARTSRPPPSRFIGE